MSEDIKGKEILNYIYPHTMDIGSEDIPQSDKVEFIVECGCEWAEPFFRFCPYLYYTEI